MKMLPRKYYYVYTYSTSFHCLLSDERSEPNMEDATNHIDLRVVTCNLDKASKLFVIHIKIQSEITAHHLLGPKHVSQIPTTMRVVATEKSLSAMKSSLLSSLSLLLKAFQKGLRMATM